MTKHRIGYSRVSTTDQNVDGQRDALAAAGVDQLFIDHFTGTKASRPEWDRAREALRSGDTLVITRLDRLGRSTKDLLDIAEWLETNDIDLVATEQAGINTASPEGKLFFTILSAFAEFEHSLIVGRTKDGLAAARARGRNGGRKPKMTSTQVNKVRALYDGGEKTVQQIADMFGVSRPTIYRALGQSE
jgi:DNA invertase Pin-like site-specific DNA recombinase